MKRIDMHFHVALVGDEWPHMGGTSNVLRSGIAYDVMLMYAGLKKDEVSDRAFRRRVIETIQNSTMDHVVCLALDPVYSESGDRCENRSNLWVDNEFVLDLQRDLGDRVLLGASVHPYDPAFNRRVAECVEKGAVLLKWLPSAQQINLAREVVGERLEFLATAGRNGGPLPLLLHVGSEYAIPSTDPKAHSYDFLSWSSWDGFWNGLRKKSERWYKPDTKAIKANLDRGLGAGATIILAHCGLPFYAPNLFKKFLEHSDFKEVKRRLKHNPKREGIAGKVFADVSACVTPFRKSYFGKMKKLPGEYLLAGSDWPVPMVELSADLGENIKDLGAVLKGDFKRLIVPDKNLLDVNYHELQHAFGEGHPMFRNFEAILAEVR